MGFGAYEKSMASDAATGGAAAAAEEKRKSEMLMGFNVNDKTEDEEIQELIELNENLQHVESRDIQDYGE